MDHPDVADAAVIGVNDELKGEVPDTCTIMHVCRSIIKLAIDYQYCIYKSNKAIHVRRIVLAIYAQQLSMQL